MRLLAKIIIIVLFFGLFETELSSAIEDQMNISADVPFEESATSGGVAPVYDSEAPQIFDAQISELSINSATIAWKTSENSTGYLFYGKTLSYEIGELEDHIGSLTSSHKIKIQNLEENTIYYFQIRSSDSAGNQGIKDGYSFKTLLKKFSFENVSRLRAVAGDSKITLFWTNPSNPDFEKNIIVRSEIFYPKNIGEGHIIYSGEGESFIDTNLVNGTIYYYSVFSFDLKGNASSGAVVSAMPNIAENSAVPPKKPIIPPKIPPEKPAEAPSETLPEKPIILPEIEKITINDFIFLQNGVKIDLKNGKLEVDPDKEITVSIDAKKIPEDVGSIMIILTRDNEEYSYLMKKDENGEDHSASIKLSSGGSFDITIAFLDRDNKIIKAISGNIIPVSTIKSPETRFSIFNYIFPFLILLLIFIMHKIIKKISKDRKAKKKKRA